MKQVRGTLSGSLCDSDTSSVHLVTGVPVTLCLVVCVTVTLHLVTSVPMTLCLVVCVTVTLHLVTGVTMILHTVACLTYAGERICEVYGKL